MTLKVSPQAPPLTSETRLAECPWIAPLRLRVLERNGLETVEHLLTHFPKRYEDRRRFDHFPSDECSEPVCICGVVKKTNLRRLRAGQKMFDVLIEEEGGTVLSGPVTLRWFNAHWIEKMFAVGHRVVAYGKAKRTGTGQIVISHPEIEIADEDAEASIHLQRIVPVHRASEGLTPRVIRRLIWDTLQQITPEGFPTLVPAALDRWPRFEALRQIHFPEDDEQLKRARQHLVLEEFFALQLTVAARRREHTAQAGAPHCGPGALLERFHAALPFPLTGAQQRAIGEIRRDLASSQPMNRMLHGDVGSGKTLVALSAMLLCVEVGFQAALMAPTQILAEQHYLTLRRLCEPLGLRVSLRTGSRKEDSGAGPLFERDSNEPRSDLVVGTHALLYEGSGIEHLGLAVIDEQHKFGVLQRARLIAQGRMPDVLVMTATPIPRTLTMTLYGDLDVSTLDELPANRGKIKTALRGSTKLPEIVKFLREQLAAGRQAYIVYPLIDESERLEAKAANTEFARWSELVAPFRCELLHGRVAPEEKDAIMDRFRRGETHVLIATSVIEVGIDVPNASFMLIESAERFGLAQLHQLRGRIGRGPHTSYCVLLSKAKDEAALEKLRTLEKTSDGFDIADADLRMRGPGDLLGTAQSGLPPLKLGDLFADADLMKLARNAAFLIFERDPQLEHAENQRFRGVLTHHHANALVHIS